MLTLNVLKAPDAAAILKSTMAAIRARGVQFVADRIQNPPANTGRSGDRGVLALTPEQQTINDRGGAIYSELCFTCHGDDGRGTPTPGAALGTTMAPTLWGSPRVNGHRDYVIKGVLHGLSGPLEGKTYPQVMVAMGSNNDQWVADIASYVRNGFGNSASWVRPADVARVRAAVGNRKEPWTVRELEASLARPLIPEANWTVTASHNPAGAPGALNFARWTTSAPQQAGMWFQIELRRRSC